MMRRRRALWLGTSIGVLLALALLTGALMTTDYLGYATIYKSIEDVKVDMLAYGHEGDIENSSIHYKDVQKELLKIEHVKIAEPVIIYNLYFTNVTSEDGRSSGDIIGSQHIRVLGIPPETNISGLHILRGNFTFKEGEIAIGAGLADYLEVDVGDNITIVSIIENVSGSVIVRINLRVVAIVEFEEPWISIMSAGGYILFSVPVGGALPTRPIEKSLDPNYGLVGDIDYIIYNFSKIVTQYEIPRYIEDRYAIFVDREKIINPWALDRTLQTLNSIEYKVEFVLSNYYSESRVDNNLAYAIQWHVLMATTIKGSLAFQLLPLVVLGIILGLIANWIAVNQRRREIGLLMVKGAKGSQIFSLISIESIIAGSFGGFVGSLLGYIAAIWSADIILPKLAEKYPPADFLIRIMDTYVIAGIIVGAIIGIIAAYYPARKASKLRVLEAISEYLEEIEVGRKLSRWTILFFVLGLYSIMELILGFPVLRFIMNIILASRLFVLIFLVVPIMILDIVLMYIGPFMFAFSGSRVISHFSTKLVRLYEILVKPLSGAMSYVAVKNFTRKPARIARVLFLISLALAMGVFHAISSATNEHRIVIDTQIRVGADISIEFLDLVDYNTSEEILRNLSQVEGVIDSARICYMGSQEYAQTWLNLYLIDADYFRVSSFKNSYFEDMDIEDALNDFAAENNIILSISAKKYYNIKRGDEFIVRLQDRQGILINYTVLGFIKFAPGIAFSIFDLQYNSPLYGFIALENLVRALNDTSRITITEILVDVDDSYNVSLVAEKILQVLEKMGLSSRTTVYEKALEEAKEFGFQSIVAFFTRVEFGFVMAIAFAGMALIMVMAILERKREIALLIAKGASYRNILGEVTGEAFLIVLIGFGLGIFIAIAYSYGLLVGSLNFAVVFTQQVFELPPGYGMTIPGFLPYVLGLSIVLFIISALIPALIIMRKPIVNELRVRH